MSPTFDMALIQRGARLRRSPYFESTLRAGCLGYTVYNHMFLPTRYDALQAEYEKLLTGVTVWDVSVERQVEIPGPDAFEFTNLLTPRDLSRCAVGQGKYVLITGEDDLRTPMAQTEEYYQALKQLGVPTKMLRFHDEAHGTGSKPSNFMRTQLYLMKWFEEYGGQPRMTSEG